MGASLPDDLDDYESGDTNDRVVSAGFAYCLKKTDGQSDIITQFHMDLLKQWIDFMKLFSPWQY